MRVLLICQAYPPYPIVGALRPRKVAKMLREREHDVIVVTERLADEEGDLREASDGIVVRTVQVGLPYRLRLVALRNRLLGRKVRLSSWDGPRTSASPQGITSNRTAGGALKRFVIDLLRIPDDQLQFVPAALRTSRRIVREGVDVVYTTAPSFSTHLVGLILRRRSSVRWIAEFRDPWILENPPRDWKPPMPLLQRLNSWMERQCLMRADVIVAVTESVGRELAAKLPAEQQSKVVVAMSGIDELRPSHVRTTAGAPYQIVYTGSFYYDRDPRPFLRGLAKWMRASDLGPGDVQVQFAGRCRHYADVSVEEIVQTLELTEVVQFHDWLGHEEIQRMLQEADLVLLLARSQPALVPNKLFEYLGSRAPILAVVDEGGESARILEHVGGQYVIAVPQGSDVTDATMHDSLALAYRRRHEQVVTNETALEALLARNQFVHLARAIGA